MIELYNIVEAADKLIDRSKGTLVLHRSMVVNPQFKIYKTFTYTIYIIGSTKEDRKVVWHHEARLNCPSDDIEKMWKEEDLNALQSLIKWISSSYFTELKDGI